MINQNLLHFLVFSDICFQFSKCLLACRVRNRIISSLQVELNLELHKRTRGQLQEELTSRAEVIPGLVPRIVEELLARMEGTLESFIFLSINHKIQGDA